MAYVYKKNLVSSSKYSIKCPYSMKPIGIAIHNTSNNASAENEVKYMINNNNQVSYHVAVDEKHVIQAIPFSRNAFHAGDGANGVGNRQYIGIEICRSTGDLATFKKCEENCAKYVAHLLKQYGWTIKNVKRHYDFSGKNCPHMTMQLGWQRFLDMVQKELDKLNKPTTTTKPTETVTKVQQVNEKHTVLQTLNIRQTPSWSGKILGQVHKHEVYTIVEVYSNGFGKLKSGAGYIPINGEYTSKVNQTTKTNSFKVKVVNCSSLNARTEPNGKIVETVKKGTILTIVGEVDGWYRTKSGLWVAKTYTQRLDG